MSASTVRIATTEDAKELLEIYAPYVQETAVSFEYTVPSVEEFQERIEHTLEKYPYLVMEQEGKIVGYAYAGPFKQRVAYDYAVETTIYVRKENRRDGIGRKLYEALEYYLRKQNIINLNACIADPEKEDQYLTKDSVRFHKRMGYELVGKFHKCGYKFNRWYDMVWMEKIIGNHIQSPDPVIWFSELEERKRNNMK